MLNSKETKKKADTYGSRIAAFPNLIREQVLRELTSSGNLDMLSLECPASISDGSILFAIFPWDGSELGGRYWARVSQVLEGHNYLEQYRLMQRKIEQDIQDIKEGSREKKK